VVWRLEKESVSVFVFYKVVCVCGCVYMGARKIPCWRTRYRDGKQIGAEEKTPEMHLLMLRRGKMHEIAD